MKYQQKDIQHFSHHHVLVTFKLDQADHEEELKSCNGCERPIIREPFHGCLSCNFRLHDGCLNTPRFLHHPSHPAHSLTLLPNPTYTTRSYSCNACGSAGSAFSLCCAECEFDLHLHCANLPSKVLLEEHSHELKLMFGSPYEDKSTKYGCDLCSKEMLPSEWLYYCSDCDFGAHLHCRTDQGQADRSNSQEIGEPQETTDAETGTPKEAENPRAIGGKPKNNPGKGTKKKPQKDQEDTEESFYEAQRKMRETALAHKLMLQALDNAADYVGPSSRTYYYY